MSTLGLALAIAQEARRLRALKSQHTKTTGATAMSTPTVALEHIRRERAALVLQYLSHSIGEANGTHLNDLIAKTMICGREVRKAIETLRLEGLHICGKPDTGYYIAETPAELESTLDFLEKRAVKSFRQIAAMKKIALPALYQQMSLRESKTDPAIDVHPQLPPSPLAQAA